MSIYINMYDKILNPTTNQFVSIKSKEGKRILKHYKIYYNQKGSFFGFFKKKKKQKKKKKKGSFFKKLALGATALAGTALAAKTLHDRNKRKSKNKKLLKTQNEKSKDAVPDLIIDVDTNTNFDNTNIPKNEPNTDRESDSDSDNTATSSNIEGNDSINEEINSAKNKKCNELNTKIKEIDNINFYQSIRKINDEKEQLKCEINTELDKSISEKKKEFNDYITSLIKKCNKCLSSNSVNEWNDSWCELAYQEIMKFNEEDFKLIENNLPSDFLEGGIIVKDLQNKLKMKKEELEKKYVNDTNNKCDKCGTYTNLEEWNSNNCNECFEKKNNYNYIQSEYYKEKLNNGAKDLETVKIEILNKNLIEEHLKNILEDLNKELSTLNPTDIAKFPNDYIHFKTQNDDSENKFNSVEKTEINTVVEKDITALLKKNSEILEQKFELFKDLVKEKSIQIDEHLSIKSFEELKKTKFTDKIMAPLSNVFSNLDQYKDTDIHKLLTDLRDKRDSLYHHYDDLFRIEGTKKKCDECGTYTELKDWTDKNCNECFEEKNNFNYIESEYYKTKLNEGDKDLNQIKSDLLRKKWKEPLPAVIEKGREDKAIAETGLLLGPSTEEIRARHDKEREEKSSLNKALTKVKNLKEEFDNDCKNISQQLSSLNVNSNTFKNDINRIEKDWASIKDKRNANEMKIECGENTDFDKIIQEKKNEYILEIKRQCDECGTYTELKDWTDNKCNECFEEKNNFNYIESDYYKTKLEEGSKNLNQLRSDLLKEKWQGSLPKVIEKSRDEAAYEESGYSINPLGESKDDARRRLDKEREEKSSLNKALTKVKNLKEEFDNDCKNISQQLSGLNVNSNTFKKDINIIEGDWASIKDKRNANEMKIECGENMDFDKMITDKKNEHADLVKNIDITNKQITERLTNLDTFSNTYEEDLDKIISDWNKIKSERDEKRITVNKEQTLSIDTIISEKKDEIAKQEYSPLDWFRTKNELYYVLSKISQFQKIKNGFKKGNIEIDDVKSLMNLYNESFKLENSIFKRIYLAKVNNDTEKIESNKKELSNLLEKQKNTWGSWLKKKSINLAPTILTLSIVALVNWSVAGIDTSEQIEPSFFDNLFTMMAPAIPGPGPLLAGGGEQDRDYYKCVIDNLKTEIDNLVAKKYNDEIKSKMESKKKILFDILDEDTSLISGIKKWNQSNSKCDDIMSFWSNPNSFGDGFEPESSEVKRDYDSLQKKQKFKCYNHEYITKKIEELNNYEKVKKEYKSISKKIIAIDTNLDDFESKIKDIEKEWENLGKFKNEKNITIKCNVDVENIINEKKTQKTISKINNKVLKIYGNDKKNLSEKKNELLKLIEESKIDDKTLNGTNFQKYYDELDSEIEKIKKEIISNCQKIKQKINLLNYKNVEFELKSKKIIEEIDQIHTYSKKITKDINSLNLKMCDKLKEDIEEETKKFNSFIDELIVKVDKCLKIKDKDEWDSKCKSDFNMIQNLNFPDVLHDYSPKINKLNKNIDKLIEHELDLDTENEIEKQCKVAGEKFNNKGVPDLNGWNELKEISLDKFNQCSRKDLYGNNIPCPIPENTKLGDCKNLTEMVNNESKRKEKETKTKKIKTKFRKNILNLKNFNTKELEKQIKKIEERCNKIQDKDKKKKCKEEVLQLKKFKNKAKKQKQFNTASKWDATTKLGKESEQNRQGLTRWTTVDKDVQMETDLQNKSMKERIKESKDKFNKNKITGGKNKKSRKKKSRKKSKKRVLKLFK